MYNIRFAESNDKKEILKFIRNNWNINHIFVKHENLFDYEFFQGRKVNFVVAEDISKEFIGILGFIQYSSQLKFSDIFTVMWKVLNISKDLTLGIKLYLFLNDHKMKSISSVGINKKTRKIYDYLGFNTGILKHFYFINEKLAGYSIAEINNIIQSNDSNNDLGKKLLFSYTHKQDFFSKEFNDIQIYNKIYKSPEFLKKRYCNHPFYIYKTIKIIFNNKLQAQIIAREQMYETNKILRILDFFGPSSSLKGIKGELKRIITENMYEYIDFYEFGLNDNDLINAGFVENDKANVIPNYFEPFQQKNIDIHFFTSLNLNEIYLFKGDGDQDRPNTVGAKKYVK